MQVSQKGILVERINFPSGLFLSRKYTGVQYSLSLSRLIQMIFSCEFGANLNSGYCLCLVLLLMTAPKKTNCFFSGFLPPVLPTTLVLTDTAYFYTTIESGTLSDRFVQQIDQKRILVTSNMDRYICLLQQILRRLQKMADLHLEQIQD